MKIVPIAAGIAVLLAGAAALTWSKYDEWFVLPKARLVVSGHMKDPASAQFRNDWLVNFDWHCGEINSKNSMGGYVGYTRFISGRLSKVLYLEESGMAGQESTEEFLRVMDKVNANLEALVPLKKQDPSLRIPSESEQFARARTQVFEDHWKEICVKKT